MSILSNSHFFIQLIYPFLKYCLEFVQNFLIYLVQKFWMFYIQNLSSFIYPEFVQNFFIFRICPIIPNKKKYTKIANLKILYKFRQFLYISFIKCKKILSQFTNHYKFCTNSIQYHTKLV